jgi:hypothetical protein
MILAHGIKHLHYFNADIPSTQHISIFPVKVLANIHSDYWFATLKGINLPFKQKKPGLTRQNPGINPGFL